jgi:hypothetical protein
MEDVLLSEAVLVLAVDVVEAASVRVVMLDMEVRDGSHDKSWFVCRAK